MSDAVAPATPAAAAPQKRDWEWFWRFLAVVMLASAAWIAWIAMQLSAPGLVLPEAFEAAAKAKASRNASGMIGAVPVGVAAPQMDVAASVAAEPGAAMPADVASPVPPAMVAASKEPPVNLEKLRMADTIDTPIPERARRPVKKAESSGTTTQ